METIVKVHVSNCYWLLVFKFHYDETKQKLITKNVLYNVILARHTNSTIKNVHCNFRITKNDKRKSRKTCRTHNSYTKNVIQYKFKRNGFSKSYCTWKKEYYQQLNGVENVDLKFLFVRVAIYTKRALVDMFYIIWWEYINLLMWKLWNKFTYI